MFAICYHSSFLIIHYYIVLSADCQCAKAAAEKNPAGAKTPTGFALPGADASGPARTAKGGKREIRGPAHSSTTVLSAAFLRTDSMPFKQLAMAL